MKLLIMQYNILLFPYLSKSVTDLKRENRRTEGASLLRVFFNILYKERMKMKQKGEVVSHWASSTSWTI